MSGPKFIGKKVKNATVNCFGYMITFEDNTVLTFYTNHASLSYDGDDSVEFNIEE